MADTDSAADVGVPLLPAMEGCAPASSAPAVEKTAPSERRVATAGREAVRFASQMRRLLREIAADSTKMIRIPEQRKLPSIKAPNLERVPLYRVLELLEDAVDFDYILKQNSSLPLTVVCEVLGFLRSVTLLRTDGEDF